MAAGEMVVVVRAVPQGYKGGYIRKDLARSVSPWQLCGHFHRTAGAAQKCGERSLRREVRRGRVHPSRVSTRGGS